MYFEKSLLLMNAFSNLEGRKWKNFELDALNFYVIDFAIHEFTFKLKVGFTDNEHSLNK